ncbi:glutamate racemase [Hahella sp. HN01]|uniref:glutamate racemase n=1 Tax=Hahella sp. HN01 TaxID=2847262 RepID=UPI001C1EDE76|nr:glutamate racemase [Hahella sp. HN01]MBU6949783.1 glutamate racemase [Hahella sp. HN01]
MTANAHETTGAIAPALIIDSGSGGLSIWGHIRRHTPWLPTLYLADFGFYPYGDKSEQEIETRVRHIVEQISERYPAQLIVVACNTASTVVLDHLRARFEQPVVGVVPAIKTAATHTKKQVIGLLATQGTVRRAYTDELIRDFASHCQVIKVGAPDLVQWGEDWVRGHSPDMTRLRAVIQPFLDAEADQVVLGCTHFPLLKPFLCQLAPDINWVDSGEAIARRVAYLLQGQQSDDGAGMRSIESTSHRAFYSGAKQDRDWERGATALGFSSAEQIVL